MTPGRALRLLPALALLGLLASLSGCNRESPSSQAPSLSLSRTLAIGDAEGFSKAQTGTALNFPADHRAHPDYRIEWWYFTGHLTAQDQGRSRHIGYQLALFRFALRADSDPGDGWDSPQVYMAHAALSLPEQQAFLFSERLSRPAAGLAGSEAQHWQVWVEDHSARSLSTAGFFPLRLRAADQAFELDLTLAAGRGPLLHGDAGYSQKSDAPGSASYYVSYSRLPTSGRVRIDDRWLEVTGESWMDQEWGSALLGDQQTGWDWLSLQLDNGYDLMIFRIRDQQQGSVTVRGSLIDPDGTVNSFVDDGASMQPTGNWRSPHSGAVYNTAWSISVPQFDLLLQIKALQPDQELRTQVVYWEGMIEASGQHRGAPVEGRGYLEMTSTQGAK